MYAISMVIKSWIWKVTMASNCRWLSYFPQILYLRKLKLHCNISPTSFKPLPMLDLQLAILLDSNSTRRVTSSLVALQRSHIKCECAYTTVSPVLWPLPQGHWWHCAVRTSFLCTIRTQKAVWLQLCMLTIPMLSNHKRVFRRVSVLPGNPWPWGIGHFSPSLVILSIGNLNYFVLAILLTLLRDLETPLHPLQLHTWTMHSNHTWQLGRTSNAWVT